MSGATVADSARAPPTGGQPGGGPGGDERATGVRASTKEVHALSELLAGQLGAGERVVDYTARPATSVGENYGSTMLALDVRVAGESGADRHIHAFCKMLPDDPEIRAIFCVDVTFVKELQMYTLVVPAMLQLQLDHEVPDEDLVSHLFPRCYGGRQSLVGEAVDEDAAILLEDMRQRGFVLGGGRGTGMDLQHARLALQGLAVLHALPIALRLTRPEVYEDTVKKACRSWVANQEGVDREGGEEKFRAAILANMKKVPELARHEDAVMALCRAWGHSVVPPVREHFASIVHNDLWTNNMLFRRDERGAPREVAFIDFQMTRINSPFKDVVFFLFSSLQPDACRAHFPDLVETYHASFCRCLRQVGVDPTPYSLEAAREEMNAVANTELFHVLSMLRFMTADPKMIQRYPETFAFREDLGGELFIERLKHVVLLFAELGWLQ